MTSTGLQLALLVAPQIGGRQVIMASFRPVKNTSRLPYHGLFLF